MLKANEKSHLNESIHDLQELRIILPPKPCDMIIIINI